jgi:ATP-dependent DNA helicase DinG
VNDSVASSTLSVQPWQHQPLQLVDQVAQVFSLSGNLAQTDPGYLPRDAQLQMAKAVADAIELQRILVVEAGTGVGKTFAYLVPALLSGAKVLISTATKSLQDQLFLRDLPRLKKALNVPISTALLKGRGNYLCLHRLGQARLYIEKPDALAQRTLTKVEQWAQGTRSGDLAEMPGLSERSSLLPLITSTKDNCLGSDCPQYRQCHVMQARREAMNADVVIVNHHLFFADMALRDTGMAELLPSVELAVFDEAHQLAEAGIHFLGKTLGTAQLLEFARDLLALGLQQAQGLTDWRQWSIAIEQSARDLRLACAGAATHRGNPLGNLRWSDRALTQEFIDSLQQVTHHLVAAHAALDTVSELSPDFVKLAERALDLQTLSRMFEQEDAGEGIRWIELTAHQARLVQSPLDIHEAMEVALNTPGKAWVFTSATLGEDEALTWFTERAGLQNHPRLTTLCLTSPFDYQNHARLYVPQELPRPNDPRHLQAVTEIVGQCSQVLQGRTFVLTTTLRALQVIGPGLESWYLQRGVSIQVLIQGQKSKRQLLDDFMAHPHCVLVGSQSFWEGIDVPGEALQCVVIDKLPFPPPSDPLVEARTRLIESRGGQPFTEYSLAEASIALQQGAGRLIRTENDQGLLIICDTRLLQMSYGRKLCNALPPMPLITEWPQALQWLEQLQGTHSHPDFSSFTS